MPSPHITAAAGGLLFQLILSSINEVPTIGFLATSASLELLLFSYLRKAGVELFLNFISFNAVFITTWLVATAIRRLYFSPLRKFPGPKLAALSKLYEAHLNSDGRLSTEVRRLHRELGDVVRTGPNELSINHVEAVSKLLSRQKHDSRGPFYDIASILGSASVLTTRSNAEHRQWRGIWDKAFQGKALEEYRPRVEHHAQRFVEVLRETEGKPVDVVPILSNFAFDIMADLGFGQETGMQNGKGDPSYMSFIHRFMRVNAVLGSLRNLLQLFPYIPDNPGIKEFRGKGMKMLDSRIAMGKSRRDIFSNLLNEDVDSGVQFTHTQLGANAHLLIIAGSDTTSSVLSCTLMELALAPEKQQKLYEEIRTVGEPLNTVNTKKLPYLQGVVDEGLRLWNPVPAGAQVVTGPEPVTVGGHVIPPRTAVRVQHLSIHTDERYFPNGDQFIPERWTDKSLGGVAEPRAFIPFSYGPHVCVGKQLALNELRMAIGLTIENFVVTTADAFDGKKFKEEWKDYYTVMVGELPLVFTPRQ